MVPLKLGGASVGGIDYVISFGVGVALVTAFMWLLFAVTLLCCYKTPLPSFQVSQLPVSLFSCLPACLPACRFSNDSQTMKAERNHIEMAPVLLVLLALLRFE